MSVEAVIATQVIDTTTIGRTVMTAANAAAIRSAIDAQVTLVSATNIKTVNGTSLLGSGDITTGGLTGTGSVDNAVLRADGTGGATLQNSALVIADNYTASPNNTVNHASLQVTGGTTNVSVSIVPKGTGSFSLQVPDGTTTGGNARGAGAVDFQTSRTAATQVASGANSLIGAGINNTVSGAYSSAFGIQNVVTGASSMASGGFNSITGNYNNALGYQNTITGGNDFGSFASGRANTITVANNETAFITGYLNSATKTYTFVHGVYGTAVRVNQYTHGADFNFLAGSGGAQFVRILAGTKTTNATPVTLTINSTATLLPTVTSGKIMFLSVDITGIKSDGSAACCYKRKVTIKNIGGTTSLVGTVETIGTDIEDSAGCDVTITADNTNDALDISVTGVAAETWRWMAVITGIELAYGT